MSNICDECCHLMSENKCRCSTGKTIGCMYIDMVKGCIHYNTETNKRCKSKVVETENGKLSLCVEHDNTKSDKECNNKVESKCNKVKSKNDTEIKQKKSKSKTNIEVKTKKQTKSKKIVNNLV